jgi:ferric-dicitrate binding protein FerR (iron transport regulator)
MNNREKYTDKDWKRLASLLSDETNGPSDEIGKFREEDHYGTDKQWNEMGKMGNNTKVNVDQAWNKIFSRIRDNGLLSKTVTIESRFRKRMIMRIAAAALIIIGLGITMLYLNKNVSGNKISIATGSQERNIEVSLPDGSKVYLNRNSELTYDKDMGQSKRNVSLKGEAFFDIIHDPSRPFIIDAGKASIKVLGTSFSVLTNNTENAVEVFVKTGTVLLTDNSGKQNLELEPGFIGTMDSNRSIRVANNDPNYLSWNTDLLVYEGKTLDAVFKDLKKVFNIDAVADDPSILRESIAATFDNQPQDTIIRIICTTFNLSYSKDGSVYHLSRK